MKIEFVGDDAMVTMRKEDLRALANTIAWNVDMDTVEIDNAEPERAAFLGDFRDQVRAALGV